MPDQPDVPHVEAGTRQPSHRIGTYFQLNERFVEAVGADKAQALLDLLKEVGASHAGASMTDITARLREGLDAIGVELSPPEIDSYADEIARSERIVDPGEPNPNE